MLAHANQANELIFHRIVENETKRNRKTERRDTEPVSESERVRMRETNVRIGLVIRSFISSTI